MKETRASTELFEETTPAKAGVRKWILPVIFLVLVPILVAAAAFSSQAPTVSGITNVVLFVLTGLLCTLVAVALTLAGCGEWLNRIEESIRTMAAQLVAVRDTQARLREVVQKGSGASEARILQEEGNHRLVQQGVAQLAGSVQTLVSHMSALGTALQTQREATQTTLAALTTGQEQLAGEIRHLHELTQTVAGGLAEAIREQTAAHSRLQDNAQAVAAGTEAIQQNQSTLQARLEDVARAGPRIFEAVTGGSAKAAQEQAAVRGLVQDNARALTAMSEALQQGRGTLHAKLQELAQAGRQMAEMVTAMAAEQKAAQEAMKQMMEDVTGTGANQVPLGEALRAHGDVINVAVATFAASEGRLTQDVRQLHEMIQTLAGGMTDAVREQAAAHDSLQQVMTGTTELIHQGQSTVQTRLDDLAGTGRQTVEAVGAVAAEQKTGLETARRTLEEVTGLGTRQAALAETARQTIEAVTTMAAGQTALHETTRHVMEEVTGVTARQAALGDAVEAHREATNTGFVGVTSGQGQLTGDVRQLHDLTRTVASGVTDTARALTETTAAIQHSQQALRMELEKLAQSATQTIEAVNAVAAGQTTGREATRHMIGELANAAIAALSGGHGPLSRMDRSLEVVAQTMAGRIPLNIELPPPAEHVIESEARQEAVPAPKLVAAQAIIHGQQMKYEAGPDRDNLGCWANPSEWAEWELEVARPGRFKVTAEIAAVASGRFQVRLGKQGLDGNAPSTGDYGRFQKVELGTVEVPTAGKTSLAVRPIPEGWQPMNLRSVELVPLA